MKLIFTYHAEFRMRKRGILKQDVEEALYFPNNIKKKHGIILLSKKTKHRENRDCMGKTEKDIRIINIYWL